MNPEDAVRKMEDLLVSMNTLERFSNIRESIRQVVMISFISILSSSFISAGVYFIDYYTVTVPIDTIDTGIGYIGAGTFAALAWVVGIITVYLVLKKTYYSANVTDWTQYLKKGPLGIIKILSRYDWEAILLRLRGAKSGFIFVAALQLLLNYILIFFFTFIGLNLLLAAIIQTQASIYTVAILSVVITVVLGDRTLKRLYDRLWSADILIGEIRRFYSEYSQRQF